MITLGYKATYTNERHKGSARYDFVSTNRVLSVLQGQGYEVSKYRESNIRKDEKKGLQKHEVRLTPREFLENPRAVGEVRPEIVFTNSYDTSEAVSIDIGLYRLVCANGLTVANGIIAGFKAKHISFDYDALTSFLNEIPGKFQLALKRVLNFQSRGMSRQDALEFASQAYELKHDPIKEDGITALTAPQIEAMRNEQEYTIPSLLRARRWDDRTDNDNLWRVFNRVQENLVRGVRGSRKITSISTSQRINSGLWELAESYL